MTDRNEYKRLKVDVGSSSYVQLGNNTYTSGAESASTVTDLLRELFITDPSEDLSKTQRIKGDRTKETCEWILERYEYTNWLRGRGLHLLWLVGPPGSGKTVISCFLVEKLQKFIEESPPSTFAYYICDNKDEHRNTASCILQGIIVQLLQTRKHLFGCVAEDYKIRKGRLSGNLPALGTIFRRILKSWTDPVYLLIDALDECEDESRGELLHLLSRLEESTNLRIMITSRPKPFTPQTGHVRIDILLNSYEINSDLSKFIDDKVKTFEKKYPSKFVDEVKEAVLRRVDGTFLWASFMLDEIATATTTKSARDKLSRMPASLEESYERMLNDIPDEDKKDAALIFQWVVVSRRPMTTVELATVMTLNSPKPWNSKAAPQGEDVEEQLDLYKSCRQLLYLDTTDDTVNLIHQSAKDYLTTLHHSSPYFINEKQAEMQIMDTCWNYLCLGFPAERVQIFSRTEQNELKWNCLSFVHVQMFRFLKYAGEEMGDNWMMTNAERIAAFVRHREDLDDIPNLRDQWLTQFVQYGDVDSVKILCEKGANTNVGSWGSPLLHVAVNRGNIEICKLLAYYGADIDCLNSRGDSALLCAIKEKHAAGAAWLLQKKSRLDRGPELIEGALTHGMEDVALLLLKAGAISNYESQSPTASQFWDPTMARSKSKTAIMNSLLFEAVRKGFYEVTKEIIQARANPASRGLNLLNRPALAGAVKAGHLTIARLLIDAGAGVGLIPGRDEQCYLGLAIKHDQIPMMELLIECGAEMEATECWGNPMLWDDEFPLSALCIASAEGNIEAADVLLKAGAKLGVGALHRAAERGHQDMVTYLLDQGEDPEGRDLFCESMTALHLAAHAGAESTIDLLVKRGANIDGRDHNGRTALHHALMYHLDLRSIMSLVRHGADVNAKTNEGQTALHIFSLYGLQSDPTEIQATQAIQILLSDGLDVNSADCHGKTALHYAAEKTNIALAKVLLDHGAFIDSPDSNGATPLHLAVAAGVHPSDMWRPKYRFEKRKMARLLIEGGANVTLRDYMGLTVLFKAAASLQHNMCLLLLRERLEPSQMCGMERMHYPHVNELQSLVNGWRLRRSRGTNRSTCREDGPQEALLTNMLFQMATYIMARQNPSAEWLIYVLGRGFHQLVPIIMPTEETDGTITHEEISKAVIYFSTALFSVSPHKSLSTIIQLYPGNLSETAFHRAIWLAILSGCEMCFRKLFGVREKAYTHNNPHFHRPHYYRLFDQLLHWGESATGSCSWEDSTEVRSLHHHQTAMIKMLLDLGGDIQKDNESPFLFQAVQAGQLHIVKLLLDYGANINKTAVSGETAIQYAMLKKNEKMVYFLLRAGADFAETETMAEILCYHLARNLTGLGPEVVVRLLNLLPKRFKFTASSVARFRDWTLKNQYTGSGILEHVSRHAD